MSDAVLWEPRPGGRVVCGLCPHRCEIEEGAEGLCRARGVRGGRMVSLVHARPATVVSDEIEKKPFFHFHPGTRALSLGTLGCNVLCVGCQNWQISHASARGEADKLALLEPDDVLSMAVRNKLSGVVFTYNEPAVWLEYVRDVAVRFGEAGMYTAFVTAGYLTAEAVDVIGPHIDAFKFDLKAPDKEGWARLSRVSDPTPALEATVRMKERHETHVEVVTNVVPGLNDSPESIERMAEWVRDSLGAKTPWHLTRFFPEYELSHVSATPLATLEKAASIARRAGLHFVYVSNIPGHASLDTVCPGCARTVIRRERIRAVTVDVRKGHCAFCGEDLHVANESI